MIDSNRTLLLVVVAFIVSFLFLLTPSILKSNQTIQDAEKLVLDEEYTTYVNGEVVDGKGVDVSRYYVEVDTDNKIVRLTTKESRNTYVPTVIPIPVK